MKNYLYLLIIPLFYLTACEQGSSFEDQIINDLSTKLPSGDCEGYPKGTKISNIEIVKIGDKGPNGMVEVYYELDYDIDGIKKHKVSSMKYLYRGNRYKLAVMGCDTDVTK